MYTAKLRLNKTEYEGTLTFETLKNIQKVLKKEFEKELTIQDIIIALSTQDFVVISVFLIETIKTVNKNIDEKEIVESFETDNIEKSIEKFENIFKYITEILEECMPRLDKSDEDEFEDIIEETKDWEFGWMQYLWETILKRNNFYSRTSKEFFEQLEIHKKANNIKDENVEEI